MEITGIQYLAASPYVTKAMIAKDFNITTRTVCSRLAELDEFIQKGRYSEYTILDGGGVVFINYLAWIDFIKYRKDLKAGRKVPRYNPRKIAEHIGWGTMIPEAM